MEAVVLCGVQGSGKTTLYRDRFLDTHVRVSLDLLGTRTREAAFLRVCLETRERRHGGGSAPFRGRSRCPYCPRPGHERVTC